MDINTLIKELDAEAKTWKYVPNTHFNTEYWVTNPINPNFELEQGLYHYTKKLGEFYLDPWGGYFQCRKARVYPDRILLQKPIAKGDDSTKLYVIMTKPRNDLIDIAQQNGHWAGVEKRGQEFLKALESLPERSEETLPIVDPLLSEPLTSETDYDKFLEKYSNTFSGKV